mmetsp:Transcript_74840/g.141818  ORF Transcript_74840/g.141818 Transcript_74840/m.141818 type:complete len:91 (+) Transcript_74840:98-370(+)
MGSMPLSDIPDLSTSTAASLPTPSPDVTHPLGEEGEEEEAADTALGGAAAAAAAAATTTDFFLAGMHTDHARLLRLLIQEAAAVSTSSEN